MKILLAIDGSAYSDAAVAEVARRPWPPGSEARLIIVDPPLDSSLLRGGSPTMFDELVQRQRAEALRHLNAAIDVLKQNAPQLVVTGILREGRPKDAILDEAEHWGAELIVVGSHGYGAIRRLFLGSVSLALAANAPCSVEIVRHPTTPSAEAPVPR
ncbi:MAG TPA: universal stress protein [Pirellulaceae bacterium]|nr:universal stress protein [Pirellulaceae bacterium]